MNIKKAVVVGLMIISTIALVGCNNNNEKGIKVVDMAGQEIIVLKILKSGSVSIDGRPDDFFWSWR